MIKMLCPGNECGQRTTGYQDLTERERLETGR